MDDKTRKRDIEDLLTSSGKPKANLVVLAGQDIGRKFEISKSEIVIGRTETCDIAIDDPDVSREHAKLILRNGELFLHDLGSTNGTLVNGAAVQNHPLVDGDRIQVGNLTILKFNLLDEIEDAFNEELYNAANRDFLTQIYNKKYFLDRLKMEFSYSRRHGSPLSLMMLDLDHFKRINDENGHIAGDTILRELAERITSMKRQEDLFARFGGEEFVLLLRETDKDTAVRIANKLRSAVSEMEFVVENKRIPVTLSIGVSTYLSNSYKNADTFLRATDVQLYKAKKAGRNCVCFSLEGLRQEEAAR